MTHLPHLLLAPVRVAQTRARLALLVTERAEAGVHDAELLAGVDALSDALLDDAERGAREMVGVAVRLVLAGVGVGALLGAALTALVLG